MRTLSFILAGYLLSLIFAAGCENSNSPSFLKKKLDTLTQEKTELTRQIERSEAEKEQLKKQIQVLSGLPSEVKPREIYDLQEVRITRYTNLYDKDKDGKKEKLIVYLQPIDKDGDIIKAAGAVDVQLWDLNKNDGQAMLGAWHTGPDELKKLWFAAIISTNYRLTFDVADKIDSFKEPLTVKVAFTDYLTGKVFKEQKVIKPR